MKEIEAKQLLPAVLELAAAISSLRVASALLAMDRKAEAMQELAEVGENLNRVLAVAQRFVDEASADDAV